MKIWLVPVVAAAACGGGGNGGGGGPSFATDHPRIYISANKDRLVAALAGPAGQRFKSTVDRFVGGDDIYAFPAWNAALMGQLSGDPSYCTAAIAAIDTQVNAAQAQISSSKTPDVAGDDYLAVGDDIGDLALVYDWCFDSIESGKRTAWLGYADQAVYNVWNNMVAKWGDASQPWSGWAVDDPSDNYFYSFLRATMLLGLAAHDEIPDAAGWITEFHDTKLMGELVPTFDMELVGGGSREGTGYGISQRGLFELYDVWAGSTGEDISTKTAQTRASMLAIMHQIVPTLDRIVPTGDQSRDSTAALFDYHRAYLEELIHLFPDDPLAPRAQALLAQSSLPKMSQQFMFGYDFIYGNDDVSVGQLDGMGTAYYAPGIGQLYARSGWDPHATWWNLTAGAYTQSHAHQDQGSIQIYKDEWLAYDAVIDSKSGLRQETGAHSLVAIGTLQQKMGSQSNLVALHTGAGYLYAAADLAPAYNGKVATLQREVVHLEPDCVVIYDRVSSGANTQTWQLATPFQPAVAGTRTTITGTKHTLSIETLSAATPTVVDLKTTDNDFTGGFRLDEAVAAGDQRHLHVLWIDGAVGSVTAAGADGVTLSVGGTTATVQFSHDTIGATLTLGGTNITLGSGVDSLPE